MSEHGFNFEGLLRSLQADAGAFFALMAVLLVIYLLVRWAVKSSMDWNEQSMALKVVHKWFLVLLLLIVAGFGINVVGRAASNRIPRSDVDRSAVYQTNSISSHRPPSRAADFFFFIPCYKQGPPARVRA